MDVYQFFSFAEILKESIKLLYNGKLMALVTTLSLLSYSIFFFFFDVSSVSFICDMLAKESLFPIISTISAEFISKREGIKENASYLLTVFFGYTLSYFIVSFFSMMAAIAVSADSYSGNNLSLKGLSLRILRSWTRPFLTAFYTTILALGYSYSALYMATPLPVFSDLSNLKHSILFCITAYIIYLYISSVWILSLVVSVIEEDGGGISALGISADIANGQKLNGFLLNIVFNLTSLAVYLMIKGGKHEKIFGLVLVNFTCLMRILTFVAYTVLYFNDKELRLTPLIP